MIQIWSHRHNIASDMLVASKGCRTTYQHSAHCTQSKQHFLWGATSICLSKPSFHYYYRHTSLVLISQYYFFRYHSVLSSATIATTTTVVIDTYNANAKQNAHSDY